MPKSNYNGKTTAGKAKGRVKAGPPKDKRLSNNKSKK